VDVFAADRTAREIITLNLFIATRELSVRLALLS
jgi:hypothetical protein